MFSVFSFGVHGAPKFIISHVCAGAMKIEENECNRKDFFQSLGIDYAQVMSVYQKHTQKVVFSNEPYVAQQTQYADGILTTNKKFVPSVVVADCLPIALFDSKTGCFGVLHSGWQGTGIVLEALRIAKKKCGVMPENLHVILGPHIQSCCYTVNENRKKHFDNLGLGQAVFLDKARMEQNNAWPYRLSLALANKILLMQAGVPEKNILETGFCSKCYKKKDFVFGSFRRESAQSESNGYTNMVAFLYYEK